MLNVPSFGFRMLVRAYARQYTLATSLPISDAEAEEYMFKERVRFCPCDVVEDMIFGQMMLANAQSMLLANQVPSETNPAEKMVEAMNRVCARIINLIKTLNAYRKVYLTHPIYKPIDSQRPDYNWSPERAAKYDADDRFEYARHWQPENEATNKDEGERHEGIEARRHEGENAATNKDALPPGVVESSNEQGLHTETIKNVATNKDASSATEKATIEQGLRAETIQNAATNKDAVPASIQKSSNEQGLLPASTQNAATNKDAAPASTKKPTIEPGSAGQKIAYPAVNTSPMGISKGAQRKAEWWARKERQRAEEQRIDAEVQQLLADDETDC